MAPSHDSDRLSILRTRVSKSPSEPGIYRWLDEEGKVLYVGKAKNLRNRLRSYVNTDKAAGPWKQSFLAQIADFDVTVTSSELEALLLETNLIKQLRPKYNVLMKDDKNYLFIKVTVRDPYPRVETTRKMIPDGSKYFGPYLSSDEAYQSLEMLQMALKYRACRHSLDVLNMGKIEARESLRPCLEFQIGRCNGLCAEKVEAGEYLRRIEHVMAYLNGQKDEVKNILEEQMRVAAAKRKFELATKIRDFLAHLKGNPEKQIVTDGTGEDSDIFGVAILSNRAHVVIMHRRNGRLIGEAHFELAGQPESSASVIEQFIPQFYDDGREIPDAVIIPEAEEPKVLQKLLEERRQKKVELIMPERGRKSHLLQLAEKNAVMKAHQLEAKWEAEKRNTTSALEELQSLLTLPTLPKRIEGYDISHLGGTETVGSMVVMKDGKAANDLYRSFTIRTMKAGEIDDYKAIREVLTRRMRRLTEDLPAEEKKWKEEGVTFGKALKKEQASIEKIHNDHPSELGNADIRYADYLVARKESEIIGFGRLCKHPKGVTELTSVWVSEPWSGGKLGQFLVRKILRSVKKGKVYVAIDPLHEGSYARIGFRYVISPPDVLTKDQIVMMWEASQNKVDPSLTARPDLIVIDGGKGQLSAGVEVLQNFGVLDTSSNRYIDESGDRQKTEGIPVIGLAKREEEIFVPGNPDPIPFPAESPAKFLLMRLRDEAHRFSNAHREKRLKHVMKASSLDDIPGIGDDTRTKLLKKFGSLSAIRAANDEELLTIMTKSQLSALRTPHV